MAIKDVLPRLRRERGLTQEELARRLYITRQAVSRWERGETTPGIDMAKLIAGRRERFRRLTQAIEADAAAEPTWDPTVSDRDLLNAERVSRFD